MKTPIILFFLLLATATLPSAAQSPNKTGDPLADICSGFLAQSGQSVSGDTNRLCTCLAEETQNRLTRREMEAYAQATSGGQAPPDAVMRKVLGIATTCLAEAQRSLSP